MPCAQKTYSQVQLFLSQKEALWFTRRRHSHALESHSRLAQFWGPTLWVTSDLTSAPQHDNYGFTEHHEIAGAQAIEDTARLSWLSREKWGLLSSVLLWGYLFEKCIVALSLYTFSLKNICIVTHISQNSELWSVKQRRFHLTVHMLLINV